MMKRKFYGRLQCKDEALWQIPKQFARADGGYLLDTANGNVLGVVDGQLAWVSKA